MQRLVLRSLLVISLMAGLGFVGYKIVLPRDILSHTLNSFPDEPWRNEWIKNQIVLIELDEKTAKALGGHGPEIFRKNLLIALRVIGDIARAKTIMIDAVFEKETQFDAALEARLEMVGHYVVWAHSEVNNRFSRRSDFISLRPGALANLPLGHTDIIYSTIAGQKLQLVAPCKISKNGAATPALALLAYEINFGANRVLSQNCNVWNGDAVDRYKTYSAPVSLRSMNSLTAKLSYENLPKLTDRSGNKWVPIRYMGPEGYFKRISFIDVLNSKELKDEIEGKIVLIGVTARDAGDRYMTAVGEMDGLELNANIIATLMRALVN